MKIRVTELGTHRPNKYPLLLYSQLWPREKYINTRKTWWNKGPALDGRRIQCGFFRKPSIMSLWIQQTFSKEALWKWIIRFILVCMHLHFPFLQNVSRFFLAYIIAVLLLYLYLIDLASSKVLFSGLELVLSILLSYRLNSKSFFWFLWLHLSPLWISSNSLRPVCISALTLKDNLGQEHHGSEEGWRSFT